MVSHNSAEYRASLDRAWSDVNLHVYSSQVKRIEAMVRHFSAFNMVGDKCEFYCAGDGGLHPHL